MNYRETKLFIVDGDKSMALGLSQYLTYKFGDNLKISTFTTGESCLEKIDQNTNFVVLAYFLNGKNGNEILKSIKLINPKTEIIMHSSNEDIGIAIDSFRNGASDYMIKGNGARKKISTVISSVVNFPVKLLVHGFGISKYLAMFLLTFAGIGLVVFIALRISH